MAPTETIWDLEPHTRAKHEILRRYLQAWMPILSQGGFPDILYIDGFAGPGRYSKGEDGSPIIALKIALSYERPLKSKIHFLFVEKNNDRAEVLRSIIDNMDLPQNFEVTVKGGETFEEAFNSSYFSFMRNGALFPTFAFIDPFGWTGAPFEIIERIMQHRSCEVFVNFMYEDVNRFLNHPQQEENFDRFFGTPDWRPIVQINDPRIRNRQLHDLYLQQLSQKANIKFVRSFEMRNERDVTDYFLFYGTNIEKGLRKMKEAMWKVDESGEFRFSDATDQDQMVLFEKAPDFDQLREKIIKKFEGQAAQCREIEKFVVQETAFRETHYKRVLKALETEGRLQILNAPPSRRKGTFGDLSLTVLIET